MGTGRHSRARWAVAAAALALTGCVAPVISMNRAPAAPIGSPAPRAADAPARLNTVPSSADEAALTESPLPSPPAWRDGRGVQGFDVSRYQENVAWDRLAASGHAFAYVKATEGNSVRSATHDDQRAAARAAGLFQGAYHYARPAQSSGTLQARFFQANGGAWSPDGRSLPGAVDLEFAETGDRCHGLSHSALVQWLREFSTEYRRLSGRVPVIYTTTEVWNACTGSDTSFSDHPLWLFDHADAPGALPAGWTRPTLWQRGVVDDLDRNVFFGTTEQLAAWAASPVR